MIAVDTNVLTYAHRAESEHHAQAVDALKRLSEGAELWALPIFCIGEFVRVATHPRLFDPPSTLEQALAAVDSLRQSPTLRVLRPGNRFLAVFAAMLHEADARGNLVFDAMIAAVCLENGARQLVTLDRDFRRFAKLTVLGLEFDG